jgi:hypothetical protein
MADILYFSITFKRQQNHYKSYFFDLFSRPAFQYAGVAYADVRKLEESGLDYIIAKNSESFSLELFRHEYKRLSRDLLSVAEGPFFTFLVDFFFDKGIPRYPGIVTATEGKITGYDLVDALSASLKTELLDELRATASSYCLPYLPLLQFARKKWPDQPLCFPGFKWEDPGIQEEFRTYMIQHFTDQNVNETIAQINHYLSSFSVPENE